jgi:tRNA(Ile2) C34 agmatinyltransferase TiaS
MHRIAVDHAKLSTVLNNRKQLWNLKGKTIPPCPRCGGETELDGLGGIACHFCGFTFFPDTTKLGA